MKKFYLSPLILVAFTINLAAQTYETASDYIGNISKEQTALTEKFLVYISAASHGKSAKKAEKRRQEVLTSLADTRYNIMGMPPFKGDRSLKDSTVNYLKLLNTVFNEDYGKIVNLEEIAEQSYDLMEAYMLAKEKAGEKLQEANERQQAALRKFAGKNNITLVEGESAVGAKMKIVNDVTDHINEVFLVFFKASNQENYLMAAAAKQSTSGIEQSLNSMGNFADEGLKKLEDIKGYNNDPALIMACKDALTFYKQEAKEGTFLTDFFLQQENFNKLKKQFDAKGARRTQQDVDDYNKAVDALNTSLKAFNKKNGELDKKRAAIVNNWNTANDKYSDKYMPTQRR